jgi:hypothetical protein
VKLLTWGSRSDEERDRADQAVAMARSHLRILLHELEELTVRIEDKARRLQDDG